MFKKFTSFFTGAPVSDSDSDSDSDSSDNATAPTTISSIFSSITNSLEGGKGPESVILVYGTNEYNVEFSQDDFEAESNPADGITVNSLKFIASKLLTPKIMGEKSASNTTKDSNSATNSSTTHNSKILNVEKFTLVFKGKKLDSNIRTLKSYGVNTGDKILVYVSNAASVAAAAAASDREKSYNRGSGGGGGKSGKGKKGKKKTSHTNNNNNNIHHHVPPPSFDRPNLGKSGVSSSTNNNNNNSHTNFAQIPKSFPKKPLTSREKIDKIVKEVDDQLVPLINKFVDNVPEDKTKRSDDHRMISETMLQKMLVLDGIDTSEDQDTDAKEGDVTLRQKRKDAVNNMHKYLAKVDEVYKLKNEQDK